MTMKNLLNLTLHTGGAMASMDEVRIVKTPKATQTWCPIGHHELVDSIVSTLRGSGLRVVHECHGLWGDGMRYFGMLQLANGSPDSDYALVAGIRNSHDQSFPAGFSVGGGVFVCDNLSFSGEVKLSRRHTARIREDLPRLITTCVGKLGAMKMTQDERIKAYKATNITDSQAHDLIIRSIDAKALPITRVPQVLQEWRKPAHEDFAPRTAWSLFNGFTEVYKQGHNAMTTLARSLPLHGLFDTMCGLQIANVSEEDAEIEVRGAV
jgi:hypothetical protein